jgi:hypothetical protein
MITSIRRPSHEQFQCIRQTRLLGPLEIRKKEPEVGLASTRIVRRGSVSAPGVGASLSSRRSAPISSRPAGHPIAKHAQVSRGRRRATDRQSCGRCGIDGAQQSNVMCASVASNCAAAGGVRISQQSHTRCAAVSRLPSEATKKPVPPMAVPGLRAWVIGERVRIDDVRQWSGLGPDSQRARDAEQQTDQAGWPKPHGRRPPHSIAIGLQHCRAGRESASNT